MLKRKPYSELELSRRRTLRETCYSTYIRRDRRGVCINHECRRRIPVLDIQDIESFEPKLKVPFLFDRKTLEHREIQVRHVRSAKNIPTQIPEGSVWNPKRAWIKPACRYVNLIRRSTALRDGLLTIRIGISRNRTCFEGIRNQVGAKVIPRIVPRGTTLDVRKISGDLQIVWRAGSRLENVISLPIPQEP